MNKSYSIIVLLAIFALVGISCDDNSEVASRIYQNGVFIVNEGPFSGGTGTISFFDRNSKTIENSIFSKVNGRPLGNIAQSISFHQGRGYIVVNNANKVEVVEDGTFESLGTIENLPFPRNFLGINQNKAYVSCWASGPGQIKVIDLTSNTVTKTIDLHFGSDAMIKIGDKVFVTNGGGFGTDNKISVISSTNDEVIHTITVDDNPNSFQVDAEGKLWILCGGKKVYNNWQIVIDQSSKGALLRIDPTNYSVLKRLEFSNISDKPVNLTINDEGNTLFYLHELGFGVFNISVSDNQLPVQPFIGASFYGLGFDPVSDYLYATDPGNYSSAGKMIRYMSTTGAAVDTFSVGIIPNGFYFKY